MAHYLKLYSDNALTKSPIKKFKKCSTFKKFGLGRLIY